MLDSLSVIRRGTECSHSVITVSAENVLKAYILLNKCHKLIISIYILAKRNQEKHLGDQRERSTTYHIY